MLLIHFNDTVLISIKEFEKVVLFLKCHFISNEFIKLSSSHPITFDFSLNTFHQ